MRKYTPKLWQFRIFSMLAIVLVGSVPVNVSAVTGYDEEFMRTNNVLFYGGGGGQCSPAQAAGKSYSTRLDIPTLTGADNAEKIWNFLIEEGLSEEQTAGLMGNIYQEAQFIPDAEEGNGIGYGIVQWSFERRAALEAKAEKLGVAVSDLGFQLAFMLDEMRNPPLVNFHGLFEKYNASADGNVWDLLIEQDNIEDSTIVFHDAFERSGDYENHGGIQHRIDYAKEVFEKFTGRSAAGAAGSAAGNAANCDPSFAGGDLIETLLAYAHPQYHNAPYPEPMPAYREVATKLENEGLFVGGGTAEIGIPGIDCGGFVSILLTQSGFEPEYNYGLDWGKGACNQTFPSVCDSPAGEYGGQQGWAMKNWNYVGKGGEINVADLHPGDVAFSNGHTFLFVGQIDGFDGQFASASYSDPPDTSFFRAPMATGGTEDGQWGAESAVNPEYTWYSKYPQPNRAPGPQPS